jgi:hypothetical protein
MKHVTLALILAILSVGMLARPTTAGLALTGPQMLHCTFATCPSIAIAGDPFATLGGLPSPFRGYGDPSLERDPVTGTLWLTYSWLDVLVTALGPPPQIDFGVRTHVARSDNGGATFSFVGALNATSPFAHPDTGGMGFAMHEVSTLAYEGAAAWQMIWLTYFDPFGEPAGPEDRRDFYYNRAVATSPGGLAGIAQPWIRGSATSPSFGAIHNLSLLPQLSDCAAFTEPALFRVGGATYLATNCVVFVGGVRHDELERLVLLRQEMNGYSYIGALLTYDDALDLGATRLEQADLALSQSGAVLLTVTPVQNTAPEHLGCVVYEVTDITSAQVQRDGAGDAVQLARITADSAGPGPSACTYDRASATGVIMVMHEYTPSPFDLAYTLHATGLHPDIDTDGDGVFDVADNCPALGNGTQDDGDADALGDACEAAPYGTSVTDPDTDDDGCADGREVRTLAFTPQQGGDRDALSPWDFFDVPVPALTASSPGGTRNEAVLLADALAVVFYAGTSDGGGANLNGVDYDTDLNGNGVDDGREYDRLPSAIPGKPWRSGAPSGAVTLSDALVAVNQAGHSCAGAQANRGPPMDVDSSNLQSAATPA